MLVAMILKDISNDLLGRTTVPMLSLRGIAGTVVDVIGVYFWIDSSIRIVTGKGMFS